MKTYIQNLLLALALLAGINQAAAQGTTAFTYQGQLRDGGTNANGAYTMIFKLFDAVTGGNAIGTNTSNPTLANGLFSVNLDFGAGAFTGSARWLDITITNGGTTQTLSPRVQVLPAPYAQFAAIAAAVTNGAITAAAIANGAVGSSQLASNLTVNGTLDVAGSLQMGGTWNVGVASVNGFTNVFNVSNPQEGMRFLIIPNNSVMVNGPFNVTGSAGQRFRVDTQGEITFDVGGGNGDPPHAIEIQSPAKSGVPNPGLVSIGNLRVGNIYGDVFIVPSVGGVNNGSLYANGNINAGGDIQASGNISASGDICGATFCGNSDRNLKEKFTPIDNQEVLERVASLPISQWNFKTDEKTRHIGPMAQDFYAAFNVGTDDKHIATVDEGGVALAAIQGLNEKLQEKDTQIEALEKRLADLERLVNASAQK
jgi:hypothetical protein